MWPHTAMCGFKAVLRYGPVTHRCDSRADHPLLYLSGSKWAGLPIAASLVLPCGGWAGLNRPPPSTTLLCTCKLNDTSRSPCGGSGTCLETTSASPLVTSRVKPTAESRARLQWSQIWSEMRLGCHLLPVTCSRRLSSDFPLKCTLFLIFFCFFFFFCLKRTHGNVWNVIFYYILSQLPSAKKV